MLRQSSKYQQLAAPGNTKGKARKPSITAIASFVLHAVALCIVTDWLAGAPFHGLQQQQQHHHHHHHHRQTGNPATFHRTLAFVGPDNTADRTKDGSMPATLSSAASISNSSLSKATSSSSSAFPGSARNAVTQGWCRHSYTVPNWQGVEVPVCNASICSGRQLLRAMQPAGRDSYTRDQRWSEQAKATYMELAYQTDKITGWVDEQHIRWVEALTKMQHDVGLYGTVAEIGVQHGKFFLPLAGFASQNEPAVAIDLFEGGQDQNVDASGLGSRAALLRNAAAVGLSQDHIHVVAGNSMTLTAANFSSMGLPAFRMISVDGGHSLETTLHDLMLAACVVRDGGIVILDDVTNPTWMGVMEALVHFSLSQSRLKLLMVGYNKAYLTTPSHVPYYVNRMKQQQDVFGCRAFHESRRMIAGGEFCYAGPEGEPGELVQEEPQQPHTVTQSAHAVQRAAYQVY